LQDLDRGGDDDDDQEGEDYICRDRPHRGFKLVAGPAQLDFVTRKNCPLCEKGLSLLEPLVAAGKIELVLRDVDQDPDLAVFTDRVPVLLKDGAVLAEGRFSKVGVRLGLLFRLRI
jgi:hypothetical protein